MKDTTKNLLKWFDSVGIKLNDNIAVRENAPGSLGVFATKDLAEGDFLAKIPKSAMLSVLNCSISELIEEEQLGGGLALTLSLMYERALGAKSKWAAYIESLAPEGEHLPMFWSEGERAWLRGTEAEGRGESDAALTADDYEENVKLLFKKHPKVFTKELLPRLTVKDFQIAASWVSSRDFGVDDIHRDSMLPLADIFDHKASIVKLSDDFAIANQPEDEDGDEGEGEEEEDGGEGEGEESEEGEEAPLGSDEEEGGEEEDPMAALFRRVSPPDVDPKWRLHIGIVDDEDEDEDALRIIAVSSIPKGGEVFNTYGEHGNDTLLCKYGFALAENPFNAVRLRREELMEAAGRVLDKAKVKKCAKFLSDHTHLMDDDEEGDPMDELELTEGGKLGGPLQVALCVLGASDFELRRWKDADGPLGKVKGQVKYSGPSEEEALGLKGADCCKEEGENDEDEDEEDVELEPKEAREVLQRIGDVAASVLSAAVALRLQRYEDVKTSGAAREIDLQHEEARVEAARKELGTCKDLKKVQTLRAKVAALTLRLSELRILHAVQQATATAEVKLDAEPAKKKAKK